MKRQAQSDLDGAHFQDMLLELRGADGDCRRSALRAFDWKSGDLRQLGWSMSQKGLDLGTAMIVFFNANPERYNYLRKDKVPLDARERCMVLDAIHRRAISGFYLPDPDRGLGDVFARILSWVERQEDDRANGRQGRWVFDPALFTPITLQAVRADADDDEDVDDAKPGATSARDRLSGKPPVDARDLLDPALLHETGKPKRVSLWRELLSPIIG